MCYGLLLVNKSFDRKHFGPQYHALNLTMRLLSNFRPCYFAAAIFVSLFVLKSNSFGIDHFISKTRRENIFLGITNQDCSWLQAKMLSKPLKDLLASGKAQIILGSHQG